MGDNKRYYWMKFQRDFFNSLRIKRLRKLAGGDTFTIIYLKMQLLSITNEGYLRYSGIFQDFAEEMAEEINEDAENIRITLQYLISCGLVEQEGDTYFLPYAAENIGSECASAERMRNLRKREKLSQCDADVTKLLRTSDVEKDIEKEKDKDIDNMSDSIKEIVDYLNQVCGTRYQSSSDKTRKLIKARLNEKFTVEDFKAVIDKKHAEWKDDPKMSQFLRPETLFGTKFEGYLNQKVSSKPGNQFNSMMKTDYDFNELERILNQ